MLLHCWQKGLLDVSLNTGNLGSDFSLVNRAAATLVTSHHFRDYFSYMDNSLNNQPSKWARSWDILGPQEMHWWSLIGKKTCYIWFKKKIDTSRIFVLSCILLMAILVRVFRAVIYLLGNCLRRCLSWKQVVPLLISVHNIDMAKKNRKLREASATTRNNPTGNSCVAILRAACSLKIFSSRALSVSIWNNFTEDLVNTV